MSKVSFRGTAGFQWVAETLVRTEEPGRARVLLVPKGMLDCCLPAQPVQARGELGAILFMTVAHLTQASRHSSLRSRVHFGCETKLARVELVRFPVHHRHPPQVAKPAKMSMLKRRLFCMIERNG